jgi:hypothetical protein
MSSCAHSARLSLRLRAQSWNSRQLKFRPSIGPRLRLAKLLAISLTVSIHRAQLYEWAAIYAAERKELLRRAGPVPNSLIKGDPLLPN